MALRCIQYVIRSYISPISAFMSLSVRGICLSNKMLIIDMRWALFLSPFSLNISIALICPNLIEIAKIPNYLQDKST